MGAVKLKKKKWGGGGGVSARVLLPDTARGWMGLLLVVACLDRLQQLPPTCMHMPSTVSSLFQC